MLHFLYEMAYLSYAHSQSQRNHKTIRFNDCNDQLKWRVVFFNT